MSGASKQLAYLAGLLVLLILFPCLSLHGETNRPAQVQFSNGDMAGGLISLTPGSEFKIFVGSTLKTLPLEQVQEIRLEPEKESIEQKWRFVEAGRTQKTKWGQPYPVRELRAIITLADGSTSQGHLYTTVLYLEGQEQTTKIVLRAKDKGNEGQTFNDLVYPVRVTFTDKALSVPGTITIKRANSNANELVALTPGAFLRVSATRTPDAKGFQLTGLPITNPFTAFRTGSEIEVDWPANADTGLTARVKQALGNAQDFFDSQELLGVQRDGTDIYSLLMLFRKGPTTLEQADSQPWRLEVWRWKDNGDRLMIAGRGYFFRGIIPKTASPPAVVLLPEVRTSEPKGGTNLP